MTSVHYVNILHHLHVIIYTFYITSFAYSTLHYLHTIVFTYFTLYIYKCATLMYSLSFFLADANFRLANSTSSPAALSDHVRSTAISQHNQCITDPYCD